MGDDVTWDGDVPARFYNNPNNTMATNDNRVSVTLTTAQKDAIRDKIIELKALLTFLISLGGNRKFAQLGENGIPWDLKIREYQVTHAAQVPGYVNLAELAKDREFFDFISEVERLLGPVTEDIKDTRAAASADVYAGDLKIYHAFEGAAFANVPGMDTVFGDLKDRFPVAYSRNPKPTP
jgi:hypothetical protein